jgi:hypothetical protein
MAVPAIELSDNPAVPRNHLFELPGAPELHPNTQ